MHSSIERAAETMVKNGIRYVVMENDNKITGMISTTDLLVIYAKEKLLLDKQSISHSVPEVLYLLFLFPCEKPCRELDFVM